MQQDQNSNDNSKKVAGIYSTPRQHWVGDGFPVRTLFSYNSHGQHISPFLMLDYAGPTRFESASSPRGVGAHPHRGFETVTIVYQGEIAHRDSTGAGGRVGPGDVQWMTAAAGIVHEEFHSSAFSRNGGTLEMVQLWVNLPARHKMSEPKYQTLLRRNIPVIDLPDSAGTLRVIAGDYAGRHGPAQTFSPVNVWDMSLQPASSVELTLPAGHNAMLVVLNGSIRVNGSQPVAAAHMLLLNRDGEQIAVEAQRGSKFLLLSGEPIDEPIAGYGPFVMNTQAQIAQAMNDFNTGRFGRMPRTGGAESASI